MNTTTDSVAGIAAPICSSNQRGPLPEWTRFPRPREREPISGLSRPTLYRLRQAGLIKVVNLRRPGCVRGTALISVSSLLNAISTTAEGQSEGV